MQKNDVKKIQYILREGAFSIKPKPGPFCKHIGKSADDLVVDQKEMIDKLQTKIKDEFKAPSHAVQVYIEQLNELSLARDLKYLAEKFQEGKIDKTLVKSIISGYQALIVKFDKEDVLNNVLQAAKKTDINELVDLGQEYKISFCQN